MGSRLYLYYGRFHFLFCMQQFLGLGQGGISFGLDLS